MKRKVPTCEKQMLMESTASESKPLLKCSHCGKTFSSRKLSVLQAHERMHTGELPFECLETGCNKRFSRKDCMMVHYLKHARVHSCSVKLCRMTFRSAIDLFRHQRFHQTQCSTCGLSCETVPMLRIHKLKAHNESDFKCTADGCSSHFTSNHELKRHVLSDQEDLLRYYLTTELCITRLIDKQQFVCLNDGCLKIFATRDEFEAHTSSHSDLSIKEHSSLPISSEHTAAVKNVEPDLRDEEETTSPDTADSNIGNQSLRNSKRLKSGLVTVTSSPSSPPSSSAPLFSSSICTILRRGRSSGTAPPREMQTVSEVAPPDRQVVEEVSKEPDISHRRPLNQLSASSRNNIENGMIIVPSEKNKTNDRCTSNSTLESADSWKRENDKLNSRIASKKKRGKPIAEMLKSGSEYSDSDSCEDISESESENKMKNHDSKSTDGTEFICPVSTCGRSFSKKSNLVAHMTALHSGSRPFVCPVKGCGQGFGFKHVLQRHHKNIHIDGKRLTSPMLFFIKNGARQNPRVIVSAFDSARYMSQSLLIGAASSKALERRKKRRTDTGLPTENFDSDSGSESD